MIFTGSSALARMRPDLGIVSKDLDMFTVDTYHCNECLDGTKNWSRFYFIRRKVNG